MGTQCGIKNSQKNYKKYERWYNKIYINHQSLEGKYNRKDEHEEIIDEEVRKSFSVGQNIKSTWTHEGPGATAIIPRTR